MTDSNSSNRQRPPLPRLKELTVSNDEINDWVTQPATRLFFKALGDNYKSLERAASAAYNPDSADGTLAKLAEIRGAMNVLFRLMNSVHGDEDSRVSLFSEEDLEEVLHND